MTQALALYGHQGVLEIWPRDNHRDDDIKIVSMTYIMSSMNIPYKQTYID